MPKRTFRITEGTPLLDLVSHARGGPGADIRLTPAQIDHIRRTVHRTPEVMVKVLSRDSNDLNAVAKHLDYIGRKGKLELETDDGDHMKGRAGKALLEDWDLDIDDVRRQAGLAPTKARKPPKLVHKLMFSMPPGTPPDKVLAAVHNFAREEFALQHRYAFVLHTDEEHPHVHLVLKAVSEQGVRLNISKATLRHWRSEFARHLRTLGVAANATERAVRGQTRKANRDSIYRAGQRGDSVYIRTQAEAIASQLAKGDIRVEPGKKALIETRKEVVRGWLRIANQLANDGQHDLVAAIRQFAEQMPLPKTEHELVAYDLLKRIREERTPDSRNFEKLHAR